MRKGKLTTVKKFRIYKESYGKPLKCDWVARVVFLDGRWNRYF